MLIKYARKWKLTCHALPSKSVAGIAALGDEGDAFEEKPEKEPTGKECQGGSHYNTDRL